MLETYLTNDGSLYHHEQAALGICTRHQPPAPLANLPRRGDVLEPQTTLETSVGGTENEPSGGPKSKKRKGEGAQTEENDKVEGDQAEVKDKPEGDVAQEKKKHKREADHKN